MTQADFDAAYAFFCQAFAFGFTLALLMYFLGVGSTAAGWLRRLDE